MTIRRLVMPVRVLALLLTLAGTASAAPRVVTDLPAVASLVSMVAPGSAVDALLPAGASPHHHALKPSRARHLQDADAIIWIGDALTPWLADTLAALAADTPRLSLLAVEGTRQLAPRDTLDGVPDAHGHDAGHGLDPHAWLDPVNARRWVEAIAALLSTIDPAAKDDYVAGARRATADLETLTATMSDALSLLQAVPLFVQHDSLQYLEQRFGLSVVGVLSGSDADRPGAARIEMLRQQLRATPGACLVAEPPGNAALLATLREGLDIPLVVIDPLGLSVTASGADYYPALLQSLVDALRGCLPSTGAG